MRIAITFDSKPFSVPYDGYKRTDGTERHSYADVRANPDIVDGFPEVAGFPELRNFLREANHTDTIFRTFGCEKGFFRLWRSEMEGEAGGLH
jgi:hypothetical protein